MERVEVAGEEEREEMEEKGLVSETREGEGI